MRLKEKWLKRFLDVTFIHEFVKCESKIFERIILEKSTALFGTVDELASYFDVEPVHFFGFLLGMEPFVNAELETIETDTQIMVKYTMHDLYATLVEKGYHEVLGIINWMAVLQSKKRISVGILRLNRRLIQSQYTITAMLHMAETYGMDCFFFSPSDVDINTRTIRAKVAENGTYVLKRVEYPDIIDNPPNVLTNEKYSEVMSSLGQKSVFLRKPLKTTKMKTYKMLYEEGTFREYLILTHPLKRFGDIDEYLEQYRGQIIVKPASGARGQGVVRVSKENDTYRIVEGKQCSELSVDGLREYYNDNFKGKSLIVQPCINSKTSQGSPFDIRIHARRGKNGRFVINYVPRIGNPKGIVSNIAKGGYSMNMDTFMKNEYGDQAQEVMKQLDKLAKTFPEYYQKFYKQEIFDIGLDIGIHNFGDGFSLHIFEVNTYLNGRHFEIDDAKTCFEYCRYIHRNAVVRSRLKKV